MKLRFFQFLADCGFRSKFWFLEEIWAIDRASQLRKKMQLPNFPPRLWKTLAQMDSKAIEEILNWQLVPDDYEAIVHSKEFESQVGKKDTAFYYFPAMDIVVTPIPRNRAKIEVSSPRHPSVSRSPPVPFT